MRICGNCKWWKTCEKDIAIDDNQYPLPSGFRYCRAMKIHEGEMCEAKQNKNIPPRDTHLLICTSEWLQHVGTSSTFGCILWEPK